MKKRTPFKTKVKNFFLYNGLTKSDYKAIAPKIFEVNRILLAVFSAIVAVMMVILLCFGGAAQNLKDNAYLYIVMVSISAVLFLLSLTACKKNAILNSICVYLFSATLLAYGIVLGCFLQNDSITVSFVVLLFAFPLVFTYRSVEADVLAVIALVVYFVLAKINQTPEIFSDNLTVVLPYGVASFAVAHVVNSTKTARFSYELKAKSLAEHDILTGLRNRTSYEENLSELRTKDTNLVLASIDINGLKRVNDTYGHAAGDELIIGAASVIQSVFGTYGKCFRTGGDEFIVIIEGMPLDANALKSELEQKASGWRGAVNERIYLSIGIVSGIPSKRIDDGLIEVDKRMYQEKNEFYENSGLRKNN